METKKNEKAKVGGLTSYFIGFIIGLAVMFVALEWTQRPSDTSDIYTAPDIHIEQEIVPITLPEKKTVPPPPAAVKPADIIKIIEDDDMTEEEDVMISTDNEEYIDLSNIDVIMVEPEPEDDTPFMVVEDMPEFPGGTSALMEYLRKNIKYPSLCRESNIQGRVIISFVVNKDGKIVDTEVVKSVHPLLDKEALRVVSSMPAWKPGMQRGRPVRVRYTVPVNFRLN